MTAQDLLMLYCCSWLLSWIGGKRWQKLRDSSQLAWQQHHKRSFMVWRQVELIWSWLGHSLLPLLGQNVLLLGRCAFGKVFSSFNCYRNNYNNVEILEKKYANPTVNFLGEWNWISYKRLLRTSHSIVFIRKQKLKWGSEAHTEILEIQKPSWDWLHTD